MDRIKELDFTKGVLISLMVLFHLKAFVDAYTGLTEWVYCFHMSGFLLISGYLQKRYENVKQLKKVIRRIVVPYIIFELLYLIGVSLVGKVLGSQNTMSLSLDGILRRMLFHPIGTYWYLHTLFVCIFVNWFVQSFKFNSFVSLSLTGCLLFILTNFVEGLLWCNVIYFLIGAFISTFNINVKQVITPSVLSVIPIVLITLCSADLDRSNLSGIGLTVFMLSFLMAVFRRLPYIFGKLFVYLGKNSLGMVLFSPFFTVLANKYAFTLNFTPPYLVWAFVSLILIVFLCLLVEFICDKLKISRLVVGGEMYKKYE